MSKTKIILIITSFLVASFISEARAQGVVFEIYVKDSKTIIEGKKEIKKVPKIEPAVEVVIAPVPLAQPAPKPVQTIAPDGRTDFTSVYVAAGTKYGIDWQILAAVHSVETGQRGNTAIRSGAGAQGPMQFIPSTFRSYAQDGDGDGVKNINDVDDAIYTAANYLAKNMQKGGSIDYALFRYNHSNAYVAKVKNIASALY